MTDVHISKGETSSQKELERLQDLLQRWPVDADGDPVILGRTYWVPSAFRSFSVPPQEVVPIAVRLVLKDEETTAPAGSWVVDDLDGYDGAYCTQLQKTPERAGWVRVQ